MGGPRIGGVEDEQQNLLHNFAREKFSRSLVPWIAPWHQLRLERLRSSKLEVQVKDLQNLKFTNVPYIQIKTLCFSKYFTHSFPALDLWGCVSSLSNEPGTP